MTIARTIIQQLGRACLGLLGAHTLVDLNDGLLFQIQGSEKVDAIQIILHPSDTYIMTFWKIETETRKLTADIPFTTMTWRKVQTTRFTGMISITLSKRRRDCILVSRTLTASAIWSGRLFF